MPILDSAGRPVSVGRIATLDRNFWTPSSSTHSYIANVEKQPYAYHVWVYRCVSAIAMNVGRLDPLLYDYKRPEHETAEHPILDLLQNPNPLMNYQQMRQYLVSLMLLQSKTGNGGQAYVLAWNGQSKKYAEMNKGEIPTELMPVSEDLIEADTVEDPKTKRRQLVGWLYGDKNQPKESREKIPLGSVIRVYFPNPYDFLSGISPLMAVELALGNDTKADVYNARVFENDGSVAGVISTDEVLPPDVKQDNINEWMKTVGGLARQRNIAILDGGLKYQQYALSMKDMEWKAQKEWGRDAIISAFGLNKIALGQYEGINFATIREGRKLLWYDTYMPIDKMICDAFNSAWVKYVGNGNLRLKSNYNNVESLRGDMSEKARTVQTFVAAGSPFELACRLSGVGLQSEDLERWPELSELPASANPFAGIDFGGGGEDDTPAGETPDKDDEKAVGPPQKRDVKIDLSEREKKADDYAKSVLIPMERSFFIKLNRHFVSQRNAVLDNVDAWYDKNKGIANLPSAVLKQVENAPEIDQLLFDVSNELERLMKAYRPTAKSAADAEVARVSAELGGGIAFSVSNELLDRWLLERTVLMGSIETATFERAHDAIASAVSDAFDEGLTVKQLQQRIKENVRDVYRVRLGEEIEPNGKFDLGGMSSSMTIARTEMGIITAQTRFDAFKTEGIEVWEWVAAKDDKVRDAHRMRDGEKVRVGDPFPHSVNGAYVAYPRDPTGDLSDIISCRCVAVAVEE